MCEFPRLVQNNYEIGYSVTYKCCQNHFLNVVITWNKKNTNVSKNEKSQYYQNYDIRRCLEIAAILGEFEDGKQLLAPPTNKKKECHSVSRDGPQIQEPFQAYLGFG